MSKNKTRPYSAKKLPRTREQRSFNFSVALALMMQGKTCALYGVSYIVRVNEEHSHGMYRFSTRERVTITDEMIFNSSWTITGNNWEKSNDSK